jgi:hypothetical protein
MRHWLVVTFCSSLIWGALAQAVEAPAKVMYRYKNDQGVTVMDSTIPPQYVDKGYEILSRSGKLIKLVEPPLAGPEADRLRAERRAREEQARADVQLRRTYSNVADIEAAKRRNLESLRGNIVILETNISSATKRLESSLSRAAELERSGRAVPEDVLKNIANLEQEIKNLQLQIQQREVEFTTMSEKFDADRQRFIEIN